MIYLHLTEKLFYTASRNRPREKKKRMVLIPAEGKLIFHKEKFLTIIYMILVLKNIMQEYTDIVTEAAG